MSLRTLAALGALGAAGYVGYRYWYLPQKLQKELDAKVAEVQAQRPGTSKADALRIIGLAGCIGAGAAAGITPQVSAPLCGALSPLLAIGVKNAPKLVLGIGRGAGAIARETGKGVASAATQVGLIPIKVISETGKGVGRMLKSAGRDLAHLFS